MSLTAEPSLPDATAGRRLSGRKVPYRIGGVIYAVRPQDAPDFPLTADRVTALLPKQIG